MKKHVLIPLAAVALVTGGFVAVAHAATRNVSCPGTVTDTTTTYTVNVSCQFPKPPRATTTVTATATVTATVTASPTPTPTSSGSPSPTATSTATPTPTPTPTPGTYACGPVPLGSGCPSVAGPNGESGYYAPAFSSNSNGWNTYVTNQDFGVNGTQSLWANGPGDWKLVSTMTDDGGRVQTFPNAQQLYDTNGAGNFPLSGFAALKVNYNETSPGGSGNHYQFSPDVFFSNYPNDVMFWVDINGRCNEGAWGPSLLGHFTMPDGSGWTAHRYDSTSTTTGNTGSEIILVKDGPGGQGTCAQESSGTIDIKAGLAWLSSHGFMPANPTLAILQTGWEITQSSNATFTVDSMSYTDAFN